VLEFLRGDKQQNTTHLLSKPTCFREGGIGDVHRTDAGVADGPEHKAVD
jgi:hypothetical protein